MKLVAAAIASVLVTLTQAANIEPILARLDAYLAGYEPQLSELIADEVMTQEISRAALSLARDKISPSAAERRRRLASEVAFIALPDGGWLGFRHVKSVNNRAVEDSDETLASSLAKSSYESAQALLKASAAHNLGLPRTTNLPNLPLHFLQQRARRLIARADGRDTVRGVTTTRVVLHERLTPTLIRNPNTGGDMPSVIRAWIDARGRLLRAEVKTFPSPQAMEIAENTVSVEFAENKALGLLVPIEMRERFPIAGTYRGTGVARYSNFRRFSTSARIIPQ